MTIYLKNKHTLQVGGFYFKCAIGKNGISKNKIEGDKKTPKGYFGIGSLYYRKDRVNITKTFIKSIEIKPKYMVQTDNQLLSFKVFINSKKRAPKIFTRFFENHFRKKFSLIGVPINLSFISSSNPYSS